MDCLKNYSLRTIHILTLIIFWGQIQNYMMRVNISILIVSMVKPSTSGSSVVQESCVELSNATSTPALAPSSKNEEDLFEWDEFTRGLIIGSFSWGYVTTQIIGGRMAELFGMKKVYGLSLFVCGLLTFLSPIMAKIHYSAFIGLRVLQGICEGVTFPSLHVITSRWVPVKERNSFIARSFFGTTFGMIITFPMCGYIASNFGWEMAFYAIGVINILWFVAFWYLVYDSPHDHPRISAEERDYIEKELKGSVNTEKHLAVPWKAILTSPPFYSLLLTDFCNCWGLFTLISNGPSYIKFMLGLDLTTTGLVTSLPMFSRYVGGVLNAYVADFLIAHDMARVVTVRRIFNSISQCSPALSMILLAYSGCNVTYAIVLLCVGCFFNGALSSGHFASYSDLSPNFSGTLFGIINTFSGSITGFVVPILIGALTQNNMTFAAWRTVFILASVIYFIGNVAYVMFIKADIQSWNYPPLDKS